MVKLSLWFGSAVFIAFSLSVRAQSPPKLVPLDSTGLITYYIADGIPPFGSQPGDIELATWAFKEWERSAGRTIRFEPIADEGVALHGQEQDFGTGDRQRSSLARYNRVLELST